MIAKLFSLVASMVLAPVIFPTGIVLYWFYFYVIAINGLLGYLTGIGFFEWVPYLLAILLGVKALLVPNNRVILSGDLRPSESRKSILLGLILLWISFVFVTSIVNGISIPQFIVGVKQYLLPWGIFALIAVTNIQPVFLEKIWKSFIVIVYIQVPVVLFQLLYYARGRAQASTGKNNDSAWDAIVGTFGGDPLAGGNSAGLAYFIVMMLLFVVVLFKHKIIKLQTVFLFLLSILSILAFAEVKIILLLIPLGMLILFRKNIVTSPFKSILIGCVTLAMMAMIFSNYQDQYYSSSSLGDSGIEGTLDNFSKTLTETDVIQKDTGELGRLTSIAIWWQENTERYDVINLFIGHGMLASRHLSNFVTDTVATEYGLWLDSNSLSILLWDFGLIGAILYIFMFIYASFCSFRLSKNKQIPAFHRVYLEVGGGVLILMLVEIVHHTSLLTIGSSQALVMLLLGQNIYWERRLLSGRAG